MNLTFLFAWLFLIKLKANLLKINFLLNWSHKLIFNIFKLIFIMMFKF